MSYTFLAETAPVARKSHRCIWCGEPINKGEKYKYTTGIFDGDFQANHWHPECCAAQRREASKTGECEFAPHENERPGLAGESKHG
ncbi:MAG: hypothetical protein NVS1B6_19740 [Steroidobacteraceae bacterium]